MWEQLRRDREQRGNWERQIRLKHEQLIRRAQQARLQAQKRAARADAEERRRQEDLGHGAGEQEAALRTKEVEYRVAALETLLVASLHTDPHLAFADLRKACELVPFDPGPPGEPAPEPQWEDHEPAPPGALGGMLGGRSRYDREVAAATERFEEARRAHREAEQGRLRELDEAREAYDARCAELEQEALTVDAFEREFHARVPEAVEEYFHMVLGQSVYPEDLPEGYRVAYRPEPRELVIECDLPTRDVIPRMRGHEYVKIRREVDELPRGDKGVRALYRSVISQMVLRTMRECFAVRAGKIVTSIVVNGVVDGREAATGRRVRRCVLSVGASRADFEDLVLEHLDPAACLKRLRAIISPNPDDLEAVEPLVEFDTAQYRFTGDALPDLLGMDWYRFESLIRELFASMGMDVEIVQSSRDHGFDAMAYVRTNAIHRAEYVIQARRYGHAVPAETVRALAGAVEEKRATRGFLVTTSWFGAASRAFATANNRLQLIDGAELKHLLSECLDLDVRIDLPKEVTSPAAGEPVTGEVMVSR